MEVWKISLLTFLAAAMGTIVITGVRRWRVNRKTPDLSGAAAARYGSIMGGNWTPPIEDNRHIMVERVDAPPAPDPLSQPPGRVKHR
ncbi:hypothetical protein MULP_041 (plasmid) [Mycobacterium liflandii 128FXT]|uniref:Uncharacterized protein n=3 Tax=Mycobacterium ulcerans group TaxID=2993898 RepID=A0A9N7QNN6_9MYCO|nr:hypothetical protein [Mycobacterium marinum]ACA51003.1 hypothetical protein MUDP_094 [Mycobacterium marinum DL240490]ACA57610.1 hypothetical protein MULP_041 [Mycobacterium liflandii 128FXT]MBC9864934.1 hypothetical protein [Mycobacterium pseudoshottsii]BDN85358.1 hypothetical protein NJB1907Z4_P0100 [Mycobacterium pseudoshottsii]